MAKSDEINQAPVKKRKSRLGLILIALLVLVAGAGGFFGWQYFSASPKTVAVQETGGAPGGEAASEETASEATTEEGDHAASGEHGEKSTQSTILNFEPFLVNLADRESSRYLRITIKLQVNSKSAAEKIASTEVVTSQIRDAILSTLSTKNSDQVITREGKDQLKTEISEKLNAFLPGKPIKAVYFTDFVVQL